MIVVRNARFGTGNRTVKCVMEFYVLLNGTPENSPRVAIGEARCAPEDKFDFKVGMDLAYDRAYAKAIEVAEKMNRQKMRFVCVKSNGNFKSGTIYFVRYDSKGKLLVIDDAGYKRPVNYPYIDEDTFFNYMKTVNMVKLED